MDVRSALLLLLAGEEGDLLLDDALRSLLLLLCAGLFAGEGGGLLLLLCAGLFAGEGGGLLVADDGGPLLLAGEFDLCICVNANTRDGGVN
jgi:hypothetical protein